MHSKLDDTTDFITLFEYAAGEWTTPPQFLRWTAMALIAACVEDRVSVPFDAASETYPNIWVFLLGPPATGKDRAIKLALSLLKPEDDLWMIDGKVTIPALYDFLASKQKLSGRSSAPLLLVSRDVTQLLPRGIEAQEFTARALSLYDRSDIHDITRTSGHKVAYNAMMTWVAGCTEDWFHQAIDALTFKAGYSSRAFFIFGEPNFDNFHLEHPTERRDADLVREFLRKKIELYLSLPPTLIAMDSEAKEIYKHWLKAQQDRIRTANLSDVERDTYGRMRANATKVAIILSLSRWDGGLLAIHRDDISTAISLVEDAYVGVKRVADLAYANSESQVVEILRAEVRATGRVARTRLLKYMSRRGVKSVKHFDELIDMLVKTGEFTTRRVKPRNGGPWPTYIEWNSRKLLLVEPKEEEPSNEEESTEPAAEDSE